MNNSPLHSYRALVSTVKKPLSGSSLREPGKNEEKAIATILVRRNPAMAAQNDDRSATFQHPSERKQLTREAFTKQYGSLPAELEQVVNFIQEQGMETIEYNAARRSVVFTGTIGQLENTFGIKIHFYHQSAGNYRSYEGAIRVPASLFGIIETITGIDNRPLPIKRHASDPNNTVALTPQRVAALYNFPAGNGAGQTIGIVEFVTSASTPGYTAGDLVQTMNGFGGGLVAPVPIDVSIDGQTNSGVADRETTLDITVASAIAQGATIAVYFAGTSVDNMLHALQTMVHPQPGQPVPGILSISYSWSPDDTTDYISDDEFKQLSELFVDARGLEITVLCASGDAGTQYLDAQQPQTAFPASDPNVLACGGTTIGNFNPNDGSFDEWVWNDIYQPFPPQAGVPGATGGGISARFAIPSYQLGLMLPARINSGTPGRGVPDVAGNASNNSGYFIFINGALGGVTTGGTSAVAPLYAGLVAIINSILVNAGHLYRSGFINPLLYAHANTICRDVDGTAGPTTNAYAQVPGYNAAPGWDPCTGLGSINGLALLTAMRIFTVKIRLHTEDRCDPGTIAGTAAVFTAEVSGALGPLVYNWIPINAAFAPGSVSTDPSVSITVPAVPGTPFSVALILSDPYGQTQAPVVNFQAIDAEVGGLVHGLCEFLIWSRQFKQPIYINPGDGPYSPFELRQLISLEEFTRRLSTTASRVLKKNKEVGNLER